jgi:hypothetical protein
MLALSGIVLVAATVVLLNGEGVVGWIGEHLHLTTITTLIWTIIQFPLAIASLVAVLWMQYYFLPNCRHQNKKILVVGATISTFLWILATLVFRLYVQKFNALNPAYGAIGAIMVLLTWMYYSSYVLLAVGELCSELQQGSGRPDKEAGENPLSGPGVPRAHALVLYKRSGKKTSRPRREGRVWVALDWFGPARAVRRVRHAAHSAQDWIVGVSDHLRADVAVAVREVGGALRGVGTGSFICAIAATVGFLGVLSLVTGVILVIGDQWLPHDWYAIAALIVALVAALATWRLMRRGMSLLGSAFQSR